MTTTDVLTHDMDGDPFTCEACSNDPGSAGGTAHNLYDYLAHGPDMVGIDQNGRDEWLAIIEDRARVAVAQRSLEDAALYCWCGHTLHYPDCACDDGLSCERRYAAELSCPDADDARARFVCPGEESEHWAESAYRLDTEPTTYQVECGHCSGVAYVRASDGATSPELAELLSVPDHCFREESPTAACITCRQPADAHTGCDCE